MHSANGLNTFPIKDEPIFIHGLWNLPKNSPNCTPPTTQRPEDVSLWSYFGRIVPDYNRTKIGSIRFLTYFDSAMPNMHLA